MCKLSRSRWVVLAVTFFLSVPVFSQTSGGSVDDNSAEHNIQITIPEVALVAIRGTSGTDISLTPVAPIEAGSDFGLAVNHAGVVYGWGGNSYGALAQGTATITGTIYKVADIERILIPEVISNLSTGSEVIGDDRIISFQGGSRNAQGLSFNGDVYSWGDMGTGYMGNGYEVDELGIDRQLAIMPVKLSALDDVFVASLSANTSSHFAVTDKNIVYAWGSTDDGRLSLSQDVCSDKNIERYAEEASSSVCYTPIEVDVTPKLTTELPQ